MKKTRGIAFVSAICMWLITGILYAGLSYAGDCDEWVAKAVSVQGEIHVKKTGKNQWTNVKPHDTFCAGDMLRVLERSRAAVVLANESVVRLDQNTTITFSGVAEKKVSLIDILKGAAHFFSRVPRSLKVSTPFVNGAVEGTEFYVEVGRDETFLSVFKGRVVAAGSAGSITLGGGQSAIARSGKAPVLHLVADPRDMVRWAVYYPAVIDYKSTDFEGSDNSWQKMVRKSIGFYRKGDLIKAFSSLDGLPGPINDARFYTYRAGLLLTVGRVDEAGSDIQKAMRLDGVNSHAIALKSIIAVAQNRKEEALHLAQQAVSNDPDSSAARVALSYAQQAVFDLQGALESLTAAVRLSPDNALAQARLSELWMCVGDLDKALVAARKAASLNPDLARTQTVLGFVRLARIKTTDAKAAFEKAIWLDQAAPLARLGLGLAKIREGDLTPGRVELEIAAGLDPNNALIRSYLGKAFFDEKQDRQSDTQLAIAKELDPNDPTPWFYDAIRKQTLNRPVEALQDLQKSIALNDNRAVYRSRLLLDEDLASRSASLGRIYNDLGFQQLALVEGWKSVNTDPGSDSAHRFLADSYAALPRHEIARVSELLQSQLLQPININPVQPHLAESETLIYEGTGPVDSGFNEYHPLFLRNRLALQASGVVGGNDIYGDEIVHSGVYDRISYSIGQFHYQTDGFRTNNDLEKDIYNVFVQASLTHKTSIQMEYRYKNLEHGDLSINFDSADFWSTSRENEKLHTIRFGGRHACTPRSDLLFSFIHQRGNDDFEIPSGFELAGDIDGTLAEIQHLLHLDRFHLTSGAGYLSSKPESETTLFLPFPPFTMTSVTELDKDHTNIYLYSQLLYPTTVSWTLGASVDFSEGGLKDRDQFNPKFGITWNPVPSVTIRGAVFRTLLRELPSHQTLEPTHVAGFNQFFDDANGTRSWVYGIGMDYAFSSALYGGMEFYTRDFEFPFTDTVTSQVQNAEWEDDMGRVYFYWTPHRNWALSAEYQYEQFSRQVFPPGVGNEVDLDTHRFPLGIRFFHCSGFTARLKATYVDQDGEFSEVLFPGVYTSVPGDDRFWVMDAAIGYRLPGRLGILTLEAKNLLDETFQYQDTDPLNPRITPESLILAKFAVAF